jgi:hypothetical protein
LSYVSTLFPSELVRCVFCVVWFCSCVSA